MIRCVGLDSEQFKFTPKRYEQMADAMRLCASYADMLPNQLQAICWLVTGKLS